MNNYIIIITIKAIIIAIITSVSITIIINK